MPEYLVKRRFISPPRPESNPGDHEPGFIVGNETPEGAIAIVRDSLIRERGEFGEVGGTYTTHPH